jgi:Tfp pilus assembly protein FimT
MNDKLFGISLHTLAAGVAAAVAGYFLAIFALPILFPRILTRQLDQSSRQVADFLQRARTESIERGAPVACRVEKHGSRTVLWLDWDITGRRVHLKGDTLELSRGLVLSQDGKPQGSGVIAYFNPRGGFQAGNTPTSVEPLVLSVSRPSRPVDGFRTVSLGRSGVFQAGNHAVAIDAVNTASTREPVSREVGAAQ